MDRRSPSTYESVRHRSPAQPFPTHIMSSSECWSCRSNTGERRISPGRPIYEGKHWLVEHAYPTLLLGWLVVVLRRHEEALHSVRPEEFTELGEVLHRTVGALHKVVGSQKEYVACYAELDHFRHVHFHVVPRAADLSDQFIGTKSFALLKVAESEAVPPSEIMALCESLRAAFEEAAGEIGLSLGTRH
jgi:diadenosine tetraphosphate (Ap4A) HIT family hydrolase